MRVLGKRSLSSRRWIDRQSRDPYVKQSRREGYRSRAAYKLIEINDKYKILNTARNILDLGAAPGGWMQVASEKSGHPSSKINKVLGVDLLNFESVPGTEQIIGDFTSLDLQNEIITVFGSEKPDLILSDMAPSTIGHQQTDHLRIMALLDEVFIFTSENLAEGGNLAVKIFHGKEETDYVNNLREIFTRVSFFKPKSSRAESSEIYIVALEKKY